MRSSLPQLRLVVAAAVLLTAAAAVRPAPCKGQQLEDVVYLKDGGVVHGTIIEQVPGQSILIQARDGNRFRYPMDRIERITREPVPSQIPVAAQSTGSPAGRPTFSLGYGNSFGGLGGEFASPSASGVSFHVGVGYFPLSMMQSGAKDIILVSGGVRIYTDAATERSRSYVDLQFGMLGGEYYSSSYYYNGSLIAGGSEQKILYGPSVLAGRDFGMGSNVALRLAVGGSYNLAKIDWAKFTWVWALDLGLVLRI